MSEIEIIRCGHQSSLQDQGRPGYARIGLARGGAMDPVALHAANALVGNAPDEAAIELAFLGVEIRMHGGTARLALAGARARLRRNMQPVCDHTSFLLRDGEALTIGRAENGMYMMLAVEGGFDVAPVLASRSFDRRAGIGGLDGRPFTAGDRIGLRKTAVAGGAERVIAPVATVDDDPIRVVLGPQCEAFTAAGLANLLKGEFVVSHAVDRMACRLLGQPVARVSGYEMISEPTMPGSIQVPPDGAPLVMLADAQTIGGYPKIATVISADLARLAQRPPGGAVRFEAVSISVAETLARALADQKPVVRAAPKAEEADYRLDRIADGAVSALAADTWEAPPASRHIA